MNKFAYEMPEIKFELVDEDIITGSFIDDETVVGGDIEDFE